LTKQEDTLLVCSEYNINDIQKQYIEQVNGQASSYTWKKIMNNKSDSSELVTLDMHRTLVENGVVFDTVDESSLGVPHIVTLFLYYNDDLIND
jgi:hypothetical protein